MLGLRNPQPTHPTRKLNPMTIVCVPQPPHQHEPILGITVGDDGIAWSIKPGLNRHELHPAPVGAICRCRCGQHYIVERAPIVSRGQQYAGLVLNKISPRKARRIIARDRPMPQTAIPE